MHTVAILALERSGGIDISIPCMIFAQAYPLGHHGPPARPLYNVRVCGPMVTTTVPYGDVAFRILPPYSWADAAAADTIWIPGLSRYTEPPPEEVIRLLRDAHGRGVRLVAICNGVFVLAATGLLDGRRAATHWTHAATLSSLYPDVRIDDAVLFVDDGDILTTAGGAAGLDLCLHLVRRDHGSAVAAETARHTVMPLQRDGGQAQVVDYVRPETGRSLEPMMRWLEDNLATDLTLEAVARRAGTSVRTLNRRFRAQTGTTPLQWLIGRRLQRARELLETTDLSVEEVASWCGFSSAITLRQHFRRTVGTTPLAYRQTYTPHPARATADSRQLSR
ncbi:helix-turn-helix domain-containing protein [Actinopolymorpha sp. B9G3]|uniref:GlxA family transcriptional regulator n=1 Tax=Actinopolymorpha sp. B9G3 TaxID=3158970 RepID=UPI0032D96A9C